MKSIRVSLIFLTSLSILLLVIVALPVKAASSTLLVERFSYQSTTSEYVRIKNISAGSINLNGYKVGDEETSGAGEGMYFLPNINLAAGASIIIARDADDWTYTNPAFPDYSFAANSKGVPVLNRYSSWASGTVGLANGGDEILILDGSDNLVDGVCYGSSSCNFNGTGNNTILSDGPLPDLTSTESGYKRNNDTDSDATTDWIGNPTAVNLTSFTSSTPSISTLLLLTILLGLAGSGLALRRKRTA